jgi:hypothetical protein
MPTYFCTSTNGRLNSEQKSKIACEITRIHADHRRRLAGSRRLVNHLSATERWRVGELSRLCPSCWWVGQGEQTWRLAFACGSRELVNQGL